MEKLGRKPNIPMTVQEGFEIDLLVPDAFEYRRCRGRQNKKRGPASCG